MIYTNMKRLEECPQYIFLNSLLLYILQWQAMDKLKGTPYYRHDVKMACGNAIKVMSAVWEKELIKISGDEEQDRTREAMLLLIKECLAEIITMSTQYFGVVAKAISMLKHDPDGVMELLSVYFVENSKEEIAA